MNSQLYRGLADLILVVHFGFVSFVVLGLVLIWIGYFRGWRFVRHWRFRLAHLLAIALVAAESLLGFICPLTRWENDLRRLAGESAYAGSFLQHWVHRIMYYDLPAIVFTAVYAAFLALVLLSFWFVKPRRTPRHWNAPEKIGDAH